MEPQAKEDRTVFKVTDHGCGMDEATMDRIFDEFYQGDTSRSAEGFGLGTVIALIGLVLFLASYPIYSFAAKRQRRKVEAQILKLCKELMK